MSWVLKFEKKNNYNSLKEQQIQFNSYKTDKEPLHKPNIYLLLKLSSFSCKFQLLFWSACLLFLLFTPHIAVITYLLPGQLSSQHFTCVLDGIWTCDLFVPVRVFDFRVQECWVHFCIIDGNFYRKVVALSWRIVMSVEGVCFRVV